MNTVFIVPTGLGAELGGHAGDANPAVKLFAGLSDILITHPNCVNASDINEMAENTWYVEGSMLDRFLEGDINLNEVKMYNKILLVVNDFTPQISNAVGAAIATIGANIVVEELIKSLVMNAELEHICASGHITGWRELVDQVKSTKHQFDALAISTPIDVDKDAALQYLRGDANVNLWGGVEAKLSKLVATKLNKPVAHAPADSGLLLDFRERVDERRAAEMLSETFLHCVFKGLHRAPTITPEGQVPTLTRYDIDVLISPAHCYGRPHRAFDAMSKPILFVQENKLVHANTNMPSCQNHILCENYWEAAGILACLKSGVTPMSVRRN